MIIFVNDTVVIGTDGEQVWRNPGSCEVPHFRGDVFTKPEVEYMIKDILNLVRLNKMLLERKSRDCVILTDYIDSFQMCEFMKEDCSIAPSNIKTRTIKQHVLQQFIDNLPAILRWL